MSREIRDMEALARLGIDARTLLDSDLGRYILAKAEKQVQDAQEDFQGCDPFDTQMVARLHREINNPLQAVKWLEEAIESGKEAEAQLEQAAEHIDD